MSTGSGAMPGGRPQAPAGRWRVAALLGGLLLTSLLMTLPLRVQAQSLVFQQAETVESDTDHFPQGPATRTVALPHDWQSSRPAPERFSSHPLWYRLRFDASPAGAEPLALYIAQACSNVRVQLNGLALDDWGQMRDPISDRCFSPILIRLPAGLLKPAGNTLDLQLAGYSRAELNSSQRSARLSVVTIGAARELTALHARTSFWRQELPKHLNAMLLMMALTTGVLALLYRRERHLFFLSGLMLGWALLSTRLWIGALPLPRLWLELLLSACPALITLCMLQFLLREQGWRHRMLDRVLLLQCAAVPASLLLGGNALRPLVSSLWTGVLGLELLAGMAFHLWLRWQQLRPGNKDNTQQRQDFVFFCSLLGLSAVAVVLELLLSQLHLPQWLPLTPLAVPLLMIGLGLHATVCVGRARMQAEHKQLQLEQRMQERLGEIERNYAQMAEQKLEQVTERERKRIAADLHDDLGAKLLTIVHTSESDRISSLAREALEEMRLSVRGLTGKPVHLLDALGDWRAELVSRLGQANILAEWKSPPEDVTHTLSARAYVQTTRILREAVSNIIKHSGATHCTVACNVQGEDFQVVVQDNGQGIPLELDGRLDKGHGMASMKSRAKQLQGQCLVESGPGWGTVIRLSIPL